MQGSSKSTPGSSVPLAMKANMARRDCDILADNGNARNALTTITSSACKKIKLIICFSILTIIDPTNCDYAYDVQLQ